MAARANWKGFLKVAELACQVGLYTAASTSDRIAFHMLNRRTGNRLSRQYVDQETGKVVERDDQQKGYETDDDKYVVLEPDEIAAAVPESDKTLTIETFIPCNEIDQVYFDKPYYLVPANGVAEKPYAVIREAMRKANVAALAQTVLFRRVRTLLIRSHECGLVATTLNFDYEVRSAKSAFSSIKEHRIEGEMLELAEHIIKTKRGKFDPSQFEDRYESALAELVQAKVEGKEIKPSKRPEPAKVVSLMDALRESAGVRGSKTGAAKRKPAKTARGKGRQAKAPATRERKAG